MGKRKAARTTKKSEKAQRTAQRAKAAGGRRRAETRIDYAALPKKLWVEWSGRQHKILDEQAARYGLPVGGPTIDLAAVARWIHDLLATHGRRILAGDAADELGSDKPTSPAMERVREADYQLRLRKLAELDKRLVDVAIVRQGLAAGAGVLRQFGDTLQRQHGADALDLFNDALADWERAIDAQFESAPQPEATP